MSPIRIDFYLLQSDQPADRRLITCRLIEKAYLKGHRVYVHCNNNQDAELIDELLWTFKPESFIPHNLQGEGPEPPPPVQIGFAKEPRGFHDILINLADDIPSFFVKFKRVFELVLNEESQKIISRNHYRSYRNVGCSINTHEIDSLVTP